MNKDLIRNWLNIIFMIGAVVGVIYYLTKDTPQSAIVMNASTWYRKLPFMGVLIACLTVQVLRYGGTL